MSTSGANGALLVCLGGNPVPIGCGFSLLSGYRVDYGPGLVKSNGDTIEGKDLTSEKREESTKVSEMISDVSTYENTMKITGKASGSLWGVNVSSSVESTSSREMSSESILFVISNIVTTSLSTLTEFEEKRLSKTAIKILTSNPTQETCKSFVEAYGTHCLIGYYAGGSFIGSVKIEANSKSDKSSLITNLAAKFSQGSASASFSQEIAKKSSTNNVTVKQDEYGEITSLTASDVATLQKANDEFLGKITNVGGGSPTVAVLYPWSYIKAIRDIVPEDLLMDNFVFAVTDASIDRARGMWSSLDYLRQSCSKERGYYLKGGPATKYCDAPLKCETVLEEFQGLAERVDKGLEKISGLSIADITNSNSSKLDMLGTEVNELKKDFEDIFTNFVSKIVYTRKLNFQYSDGKSVTILGPAEIMAVGRDLTASTLLVQDKDLFIKYVWNPVYMESFNVRVYVEGSSKLTVSLSNFSTEHVIEKDGQKALEIGPWMD